MAKISSNILFVDFSRRIELIKRAQNVKLALNDFYKRRNIYNENGLNYKLEKAYSFYKIIYKEYLSVVEQTIIFLYVIFPNDRKFLQFLKNNNNDFNKVAELYDVPVGLVKLRYKNLKDMLNHEKELDNTNKLIKKQ